MSRLKTASEMRQVIKMNDYGVNSSLVNRVMSNIERATRNGETEISEWFDRADARAVDLTFTPLGYVITYKSFDKIKDRYWLSIVW